MGLDLLGGCLALSHRSEGGGTWGMVGLDLLNSTHAFQLLGAKSESGPWE